MKTTQNFVEYCISNQTGTGFNKKWLNKHFSVVQKNLMNDEKGLVAFVGFKDYISPTKHQSNFAYLITDKRIIMAQKKLIGETIVSVSLKNINDISMSIGMIFGQITFDSIKETFSVRIPKEHAQNVFNLVHEVIRL